MQLAQGTDPAAAVEPIAAAVCLSCTSPAGTLLRPNPPVREHRKRGSRPPPIHPTQCHKTPPLRRRGEAQTGSVPRRISWQRIVPAVCKPYYWPHPSASQLSDLLWEGAACI
jgi:hypothetical protein